MPNTKWCPQCQAERPITDFYKSVRGDGLSSYCIPHHLAASRRSLQAKRVAFIEAMGGCCERCGFSDPRALQIDHVNGGGRAQTRDNRANTAAYYRKVLANRDQYMLLCANCNWIKKHEQNETVGDRVYARQVPTERRQGPGKGSSVSSKQALARARTREHQAAAGHANKGKANPKLAEWRRGTKLVEGRYVRPE